VIGHQSDRLRELVNCRQLDRIVSMTQVAHPESLAGGLPAGTIRGDETVVLACRPSRWFVLLSPIRWIAGLVILAVLITLVCAAMQQLNVLPDWTVGLTWLVAIAVSMMLVGWSVLDRRCRVYVLTTKRLLTSSGVIRRTIYETSLVNLRQTMIDVGVLERCTRTGSVLFATAGTARYDTAWWMLSDPAAVQQQVQSMLSRATRSQPT
tara:strand:- start:308 stop:931 length:624 start_codon:yes stop_codon:yes gene_type:complete